MKTAFQMLMTLVAITGAYASEGKLRDLKTSKEFLATCPEKYRTTIYISVQVGDVDYCDCPREKINYIDRHEGGPGFFCEE